METGRTHITTNIRPHGMNGMAHISIGDTIDVPPSHTLYCNNLNDKIHKSDLVACLYELFIPYGDVIDIVTKKGQAHRGQSFVVFSDIGCATSALRSLQGKEVLDKPIRIQYAKQKSDAILKREGKYKFRWTPNQKLQYENTVNEAGKAGAISYTPSVTLFVENLPPTITKLGLDALFGQYPGHIECRLVEGRGVAFIDFKSSLQAEVAMDGLQLFKVAPNYSIKITLANE